jgi:hypothetical protein
MVMQTLARRRRMRHAISFLRVVVAVVIVVFALIGFLYVTRGGALKRVRGVGVTSGTVSAALRAAGVEVVAFRPLRISMLNVAQNRSHVRAIVIDGRIGWTGGFGIDDKWLGDGRSNGGWRDTNVRFEGPAVRQLEAAFAAAWTEATGELLTGRITVPVARDGAVRAGLVYAPPTLGSTVAERFWRSRSPPLARRSTSPTRTSHRKTISSTCSLLPPGVTWMCGFCFPDRERTSDWRGVRLVPGTTDCLRRASACSSGNRPLCTPRPSWSTSSGRPLAQ